MGDDVRFESLSEHYAPWDLVSVQGNVIEVDVRIEALSVTKFKGWVVEERPQSVVLAAIVERRSAPDHTDDLILRRETVRLREPLGLRKLSGCDPQNLKHGDCRNQ